LSSLKVSPLGGGASSILSPAAHWNYFHLSFCSKVRGGLRLKRSWLGSSGRDAWRNWGGAANSWR
jgi:hypothetical protein